MLFFIFPRPTLFFHVNNTRTAAKASGELRPPRRYQKIILYVVSVPSQNLVEGYRRHHRASTVEEKEGLAVEEEEEDDDVRSC